MLITSASQSSDFGKRLVFEIASRQPRHAYILLAPILSEHTPFRFLDLIGDCLAESPINKLDPFLAEIAAHVTIGGWTVIASALRTRISVDLAGSLERTYRFIIQADTWYACDCFGERVLGQAVVDQFEAALSLLSRWLTDENRWVRRSVGVAGHLWAKRAKGAEKYRTQAADLLDFYIPMLEERQIDAAKGVGWAFKTLGRYYPQVLINFLNEHSNARLTAVIRRKALKFLTEAMKSQLKR